MGQATPLRCKRCKKEVVHRLVAGMMECTNCGKRTIIKIGDSRPTKFGSKATRHGGHWYQSGLEGRVGADLQLALKGKLIQNVEWQVAITLSERGIWLANYKIDFKVTHNDGAIEWIEAKGAETERFRIVKRLMLLYLLDHPTELYTVFKDENTKEFYRNGRRSDRGGFWKR